MEQGLLCPLIFYTLLYFYSQYDVGAPVLCDMNGTTSLVGLTSDRLTQSRQFDDTHAVSIVYMFSTEPDRVVCNDIVLIITY